MTRRSSSAWWRPAKASTIWRRSPPSTASMWSISARTTSLPRSASRAFGDPEIMQAVARLIAACRANGKWAGLGGERDIARQQQFIRDGVQFLTTQTDIAFLMAEATRRVGELRKAREP